MAVENPTAERWLPVVGYADRYRGRYEVSDLGRVRSLDQVIHVAYGNHTKTLRGRVRALTATRKGYLSVLLSSGGRKNCVRVHRLVLEAFVRPAKPGEDCNHKNFDTSDNRLENLEWVTRRENCIHAVSGGHAPDNRGELHGNAKLTAAAVVDIRTRAAGGHRKSAIAREYGVSHATISAICYRKAWVHVD